MSTPRFERVLAMLYTDAKARKRLFDDTEAFIRDEKLPPDEADAIRKIDRIGLGFAAESFARKRAGRLEGSHRPRARKR